MIELTEEDRELLEDARYCVAYAADGAFENRFGNDRENDKSHRVRIMSMIDRLVGSNTSSTKGKPLTFDELDAIIAADGRGWLQTDGVIAIFLALKEREFCSGEHPELPWYAKENDEKR
jgi:hypothetical protein